MSWVRWWWWWRGDCGVAASGRCGGWVVCMLTHLVVEIGVVLEVLVDELGNIVGAVWMVLPAREAVLA